MKKLFLLLAIIPLITGTIMGQRMVDQTNINIVDFQSLSPYQPNPVQNMSVGNGTYRVNGQLEGRGLYMECVLSPIPDEGYVWRAYGVDYRNSRVVSALTPAAVPTEVCGVYFTAPSFNNQDDSHSSGYDKKKRSSEYNRHEAICKGCDGDGKCRKCNGKGYYPDGRKCTYCRTSGDCPNCGGVGKKYGFF